LDWIDLAQNGDQWGGSCERGNEPSGSIKCWEVPEWLHNWQLLKKGSAPWMSEWVSESTHGTELYVNSLLWTLQFLFSSFRRQTTLNLTWTDFSKFCISHLTHSGDHTVWKIWRLLILVDRYESFGRTYCLHLQGRTSNLISKWKVIFYHLTADNADFFPQNLRSARQHRLKTVAGAVQFQRRLI
jgi:hypothetical protein